MAQHGFGIVGCGMIAEFHARAIAEIPGARLVAVMSRSPANGAKIAALAEGAPARSTTRSKPCWPTPRSTVVCVCTPSGAHLEPAVAAARAGKHVVVEKPLEVTLPRCDAIIQACDEAGVRLAAIFPSRFSPANLALKAAIDAGRFGRLTLADTAVKWWRSQEYYDSGKWRGTWDLDGGGALMNQAIHNVDLLQWLMGEVVSLQAMTATLAHERIEVEDAAAACCGSGPGRSGRSGQHRSLPRPPQADRGPRRPRLGAGRAGRHHLLVVPGRRTRRRRPPPADRRRLGRCGRPEGDQPRRPPRPARRLPPRDRLGPPCPRRRPRRAQGGRDHPGDLPVCPPRPPGHASAVGRRQTWPRLSECCLPNRQRRVDQCVPAPAEGATEAVIGIAKSPTRLRRSEWMWFELFWVLFNSMTKVGPWIM